MTDVKNSRHTKSTEIEEKSDLLVIIENLFPEPIIDRDWLQKETEETEKEIKKFLKAEEKRLHELTEYYRNKNRQTVAGENKEKDGKKYDKSMGKVG